MQIFNRYVSGRHLTVFGFETVLIMVSILIAAHATGPSESALTQVWRVVLLTGVCTLTLYYNELYDLTAVHSLRQVAIRVVQGVGMAAIALGVVAVLIPAAMISSRAYLIALFAVALAIPVWRMAFHAVSEEAHLEKSVLILGTGEVAQAVERQIFNQRAFPYHVVGFVEDRAGVPAGRALGHVEDLSDLIATHAIDLVIVGTSERRGSLPVQKLLQAKLAGVRVEDAATTYEQLTGKLLIEGLKPSWLVFSDGFRVAHTTRSMKRLLDLLLAAVGLVLALPLMVLTAIAIRLESPGSVLYRQERVGENGRVFTLCKFRSMRHDAEAGTPVWAKVNDTRVTRVGRFIRRTRLDELPQLWNVVRGDMSFVGPRPERPFFVEQLTAILPLYAMRHAVKPGVTGWAQVKYRYGSSIEDAMEKLRYDLYYIKHLSIAFDLTIVLDTVKVILCRQGAV